MQSASKSSHVNGETHFILLRVLTKGTFCWLAADNGDAFACLSSRTTSILKRLIKNSCVKLKCMVAEDRLSKASHQWKRSGKATEVLVDINIYGHQHIAEEIGNTLADARMFLQPPTYDPETSSHENPQYLQLPDVSSLDLIEQVIEGGRGSETIEPKPASSSEIDIVLDHIPQPKFLSQTFSDHRIQTNLIK